MQGITSYVYDDRNRMVKANIVKTKGNEREVISYSYALGLSIEGDLSGNFKSGYAGKKYDSSTGKYDYGFRDYSPDMARFVSVDPIRDGANWYNYCNSDPVNFVDLWGLSARDKYMKDEVYVFVDYTLIGGLTDSLSNKYSSSAFRTVGFDWSRQYAKLGWIENIEGRK